MHQQCDRTKMYHHLTSELHIHLAALRVATKACLTLPQAAHICGRCRLSPPRLSVTTVEPTIGFFLDRNAVEESTTITAFSIAAVIPNPSTKLILFALLGLALVWASLI